MATATVAVYDEIAESVAQWAAMYRMFFAGLQRGGEIIEAPGLVVTCAGTLLPLCNGAVFTSEVQDKCDLEERIAMASGAFTERHLSGVFSVCDALIPLALLDVVPATFARFGYAPTMAMTGMAADHVLPPFRCLPELRYQRITDAGAAEVLARLNILAYGLPSNWGHDWASHMDIGEIEAFGFLGYLGDQPVTCAATIPLEDCLYVALVATAPDQRGRGYAEAVMRHSLNVAAEATGVTRTVLHASDTGRPIYARMGYHDTAHFSFYGEASL